MHPLPESFTTPKLILANAWDALATDTGGHYSTHFVRGDRVAIKEARSRLFTRADLDNLMPPPTHFGVHRIVMGSEEGYGFNNNGDSYPAEMLARDHPTFVTDGLVYREHENNHPRHAIGVIKAAKFSPATQRVETVEWVEIKKAAREYEMAKAGQELHASQSCKIPFDNCSVCDHEARNPSLWCGCLKNHLRQYMSWHKKYAFARNKYCRFFDSSIVANPADITARYLEYRFPDGVMKAASEQSGVITGYDLHCFMEQGRRTQLDLTAKQAAILRALARLEDLTVPDVFRDHVAKQASQAPDPIQQDTVNALGQHILPASLFRKLANRRILLPFDAFASLTTGRSLQSLREDPDFQKAASALPEIFRAIASALEAGEPCGCCQEDLDLFNCGGSASAAMDPGNCDMVDRAIQDMAEQAGFEEEPVRQRAVRIIVRVKKASQDASTTARPVKDMPPLVTLYGCYKLAALQGMDLSGQQLNEMAAYAVAQNLSQLA